MITGGKITYGRTIKTGDFESARADTELSFVVPEGDDAQAWADRVSGMVVAKTEELLSKKRSGDAAKAAYAAKAGTANPPVETPAANKRTPRQPPKATPAATEPPKADQADASSSTRPGQQAQDDLGDLMGEPAPEKPKEVSDQELVAAVTRINGRIKNAPAIRALIVEYVGSPPKGLKDMPQAKRQEFLEKAEKLPAAS